MLLLVLCRGFVWFDAMFYSRWHASCSSKNEWRGESPPYLWIFRILSLAGSIKVEVERGVYVFPDPCLVVLDSPTKDLGIDCCRVIDPLSFQSTSSSRCVSGCGLLACFGACCSSLLPCSGCCCCIDRSIARCLCFCFGCCALLPCSELLIYNALRERVVRVVYKLGILNS